MDKPTSSLIFSLGVIGWFISVFFISGCKLIDQRTFDPNAGKPPHIPTQAPPATTTAVPPLIAIQAGTPQEQWQSPVEKIAHQALARKHSVLFMVHCLVPQGGTLTTEQATMFKIVQGTGLAVTQSLLAAGVPKTQIEISTMTDPNLKKPVIQVYVR